MPFRAAHYAPGYSVRDFRVAPCWYAGVCQGEIYQKMKITIVQGAFLPVPPVMGGAVEKVWYALGSEFARSGHEVTHISRGYGDLPTMETHAGVFHHRVPGYDTPSSLAKLKALDLLYSIRVLRSLPRADILVTNTFWLPVLAQHIQRRVGRLYVHVQRYPKGQMGLYSKSARLQTVSKVIANAIKGQSPNSAARVNVIPNPLPGSAFSDAVIPIADRPKRILFVGRIHPEKGIELLLAAFARLVNGDEHKKDWRLIVVGPWESKFGGGGGLFMDKLREQSRVGFGDPGKVEWVGPVFDASLLRMHFENSRIFVYPSLAGKGEASPVAPLEAMACGCATLVSDLECFRDYLTPDVNGFVFDHRGEGGALRLAVRLLELTDAPETLQAVATQGIITARTFAAETVSRAYLNDFDRVLAEAKP